MKLTCYQVDQQPAEMVPGSPDRDWMDRFSDRHPYRCLPLVVANTTGWSLLSPVSFTATWTGGPRMEDIRLDPDDGTPRALLDRWAVSHFSGGVLTFHTGWLFRTDPGWDLWVGGPPNHIKDGIQPLAGVVETYWLPFPFTMNWRFTRPGTVRFRKGDPFCFVTFCPHALMDNVTPKLANLDDEPKLKADYTEWGISRAEFNKALHDGDPNAVSKKWQRGYFQGKDLEGNAPLFHVNKRRLKAPE